MFLSPAASRHFLNFLESFDADGNVDCLVDSLCRDKDFIDLLRLEGEAKKSAESLQIELRDYLIGEEYQEYIIPRILDSYPEKKRLFFVHLPKCAGTDLRSHLSSRFPSISFRIAERQWMTGALFFEELKRVASAMASNGHIFVEGHITLGWWLDHALCRPQDSIFTVIRNPTDITISKINYVLQRFIYDPNAEWEDTRHFLEVLALKQKDIKTILSNAGVICRDMLYNPVITHSNVMCHFLGNGSYLSAISNIIAANVEVATVDTYRRWTTERWNIRRQTKINESTKFIGLHQLSTVDLDYIDHINAEDWKLFEHIRTRIWLSGGPSIRGQDLV